METFSGPESGPLSTGFTVIRFYCYSLQCSVHSALWKSSLACSRSLLPLSSRESSPLRPFPSCVKKKAKKKWGKLLEKTRRDSSYQRIFSFPFFPFPRYNPFPFWNYHLLLLKALGGCTEKAGPFQNNLFRNPPSPGAAPILRILKVQHSNLPQVLQKPPSTVKELQFACRQDGRMFSIKGTKYHGR